MNIEDLKNELQEALNDEKITIIQGKIRINEENKAGNISSEEAQNLWQDINSQFGDETTGF